MTDREPVEVTNLDRYGSPLLLGSRLRDLLVASPAQPGTPYFLGTSRPDGRPHAASVGAGWLDGDLYFTSGPGTRKARNLAANPACTFSVGLEGIDPGPGGRGGQGHRSADTGAGGPPVPRGRVACRGGGRRVHRAVQRPQRRTAAVAPVPLHLPQRVRGRHRGAVRRDSLALRTLTGAASGQQRPRRATSERVTGGRFTVRSLRWRIRRGSILTVTAGCGRFPGFLSCRCRRQDGRRRRPPAGPALKKMVKEVLTGRPL
jgi:hypothetical protein